MNSSLGFNRSGRTFGGKKRNNNGNTTGRDHNFVQRARRKRRMRDWENNRLQEQSKLASYARAMQNQANNICARMLHKANT